MDKTFTRIAVAMALTLALRGQRAGAQGPQPADTVTGRVTSTDSVPIPGADVRIATENGEERALRSDTAGSFTFVLQQAETYFLSVRAFGFVPLVLSVDIPRGARRVERSIRLSPMQFTLSRISVIASNARERKPSPGDRSGVWTSYLAKDLPVEAGNFLDLAAIQEGVVRLPPDGSMVSINAQPGDQNARTVDGSTFAGLDLPSEAVRSVGVITDTYDVSRGQFSGGQIVATTISGTNKWGAALRFKADDPALRFGIDRQTSLRADRNLTLSTGGGGALVRNKLFVYAAADFSQSRNTSATTIFNSSSATVRQLAPDSVARLQSILRSFGLLPSNIGAPQFKSGLTSVLARVDYALSENYSLTARIDARSSELARPYPYSVPALTGKTSTRDRSAGFLGQFASARGGWSNELRFYRSSDASRTGAPNSLPTGEISSSSLLAPNESGDFFVEFGGTPGGMRTQHSLTEISDDLVHETREGKHRIKSGALFQRQSVLVVDNANLGNFLFYDLNALASGRAQSFSRSLNPHVGQALRDYTVFYLGEIWQPGKAFGLTYGLRLERNAYEDRPAAADAAQKFLSGASSLVPGDLSLMPRVGFNYETGGRHSIGFHGGVGEFTGTASLFSLASVWEDAGRGATTLFCAGDAVPLADWRGYTEGSVPIPSSCGGASTEFAEEVPPLTVFSRDFAPPRVWKGSLGIGGRFNPQWGMHVEARLISGTRLATSLDRNLVAHEAFKLPAEGDRPLYAAPTDVDSSTGHVALAASRIDPAFGIATEVGAAGRSLTQQLTASITGSTPQSGLVSVGYTFSRSRTFGAGGFGQNPPQGTTAGDPRKGEWQNASFTPRHLVQVLWAKHVTEYSRISALGRLSSGLPFTPMVRGDVNGDGLENDRAFVFTPGDSSGSQTGADIDRLLNSSSGAIRRCLQRQEGRIAGPGSCQSQWASSLDIRAEYETWGKVYPRLTFTAFASNVTAGFDYLLHGRTKIRNWGQYAFPDPTLLEVRGFDSQSRTFRYRVNPNFGKPVSGFLRMPFRLILEARIAVGEDPRAQPLMSQVESMSGASSGQIRVQLLSIIRNTPAIVLKLSASDSSEMNLTLAQRVRLQSVADSLNPLVDSVAGKFVAWWSTKTPMTALRRAQFEEYSDEASGVVQVGIKRTRTILTPDQWRKLPEWATRRLQAGELNGLNLKFWRPSETP